MEQRIGSKLGKEYVKAIHCHPAYLTYTQSTSCEMSGWMKHKLESRWPGEIWITSDRQMTSPLWQKAKRNFWRRASWWRWESEKAGLKCNIQKAEKMASGPITLWQTDGETMEPVTDFIFLGSKITADGDCSYEIKRCLFLRRKAITNLDSVLKSRHYFTNKGPSSQSYGFSSSPIYMWELDHKEDWTPKNWCFWTVVSEKTLESPLDTKEIKPVNPKGNQPWIFVGRTDAEAAILWPPDVKSQLIRKDPDVGKDWRQEMGMTEDEMVGWYHWLNGYEFEQAPGDDEGQGSLACCSPQGCRVRTWLNFLNWIASHQAPLSLGFPRQEHWSGQSFHSLGNLPNSGTEPALRSRFFTTEPPGKPNCGITAYKATKLPPF